MFVFEPDQTAVAESRVQPLGILDVFDEARQDQLELAHARMQIVQERPGLMLMLEADDGVVRVADGRAGRVPLLAQMRTRPFFCPRRASSWNHTSIGVPSGRWPMWAASVTAKFF